MIDVKPSDIHRKAYDEIGGLWAIIVLGNLESEDTNCTWRLNINLSNPELCKGRNIYLVFYFKDSLKHP